MPYYTDNTRRRANAWSVSLVNSIFILINVAVFIWMTLTGDTGSSSYMYAHGASFWPDIFYRHQYFRLVTCAFIHFGFSHILNNMLVLAFIGDNLERALGSAKYAVFYMLAAVGASLVSAVWAMVTGSYAISGGASGAVFGVVGGLLYIIIKNKGKLEDISSTQLGIFVVFSIYHGITSIGVDNAAHVGGLVVGILLAMVMYRKRPARSRKPQREEMYYYDEEDMR